MGKYSVNETFCAFNEPNSPVGQISKLNGTGASNGRVDVGIPIDLMKVMWSAAWAVTGAAETETNGPAELRPFTVLVTVVPFGVGPLGNLSDTPSSAAVPGSTLDVKVHVTTRLAGSNDELASTVAGPSNTTSLGALENCEAIVSVITTLSQVSAAVFPLQVNLIL